MTETNRGTYLEIFGIHSLSAFITTIESFSLHGIALVHVHVMWKAIVLILLCWSLLLASVDCFITPCSPSVRKSVTSALYAEKKISKVLDDNFISDFCIGTNTFWKGLVLKRVRDFVEVRPATEHSNIFEQLTSPPESPGIPRPVSLTIIGSVPTGLIWYGYYKFSVEEELYQYELQETGKVSGCGGYGTLFPFVYGILIGFPASFLHIPGGEFLVQAAGAWILLGQINLYNRVNELCTESEEMKSKLGLTEGPLVEWWAILPPPLDVVVGLRQVHFLSEYWRVKRGYPKKDDIIAEKLFPFISLPEKFTLKEFFRRPKHWFWFTTEWKDLEFEFLKD